MTPEMNPSHCPVCGRTAHFCYTTLEEAQKQSPLCWAEDERDCYRIAERAKARQAVERACGIGGRDGDA